MLQRKGQSVTALLITFLIIVIVISILSWSWSQGPAIPTSPTQIVDYYSKVFEDPQVKKNPGILLLTLIVPFLSSFAIIWALTSVISIFSGKRGEKAAGVFSLGLALYTTPMMSLMLQYAFPWFVLVSAFGVLTAIVIKVWGGAYKEAKESGLSSLKWSQEEKTKTEEGEKKETEKKEEREKEEEKATEESKGRDLLENWRRAIEGYWRLLDKIKNFSIDKKILNFSSHQDWGNFCEALKNLEDVKRKVYSLVREMREGLHEVDNLERLRNLFREWYPSHILPDLLKSLDELERQYHIAKQKSSLLEGKIDELISGVKEDMKNSYRLALQRLIKEYSSKLLLYKDLIDYRNSDAGNLKALRNKTIKELGINF